MAKRKKKNKAKLKPWMCLCQVTTADQFKNFYINTQCVVCRPDLAGTNAVKLGAMPMKKKDRKRCMKGVYEKNTRKSVAFVSQHEAKLASLLDQVTASQTSDLTKFEKELRCNMRKSHHPKPIARDNALDHQLLDEWNCKQDKNDKYRQLQTFRSQLPVFAMKNVILDMINENQVSLISGQTGSGKTTQVAQFVLDQHIEQKQGSLCHIICTQPRRISAISVAQRIAYERGEKLGQSCGYQIRLENSWPRRQGSILFCTPGVLLRTMIGDPTVSRASHLIIDEVHERDIFTDFLLIVIKAALLKRTDLKVILMSATLNADSFSSYFHGCPALNVPGRTHPVKEVFLEELFSLINFVVPVPKEPVFGKRVSTKSRKGKMKKLISKQHGCVGYPEYLSSIQKQYAPQVIENLTNMDFGVIPYKLIIATVAYICETAEDQGAILIFLPGWKDIDYLVNKFRKDGRFKCVEKFLILPIHSKLDSALQREVFAKPQPGCRKIILGTNIVETSVTIDDVVYIIDTGKCKESSYDAELGFATLASGWVSKASLTQRQGRAGRVKPGICYRLFTQHHKESFQEFPTPEIVKTPLPQLCLTTKVLKVGKAWPFFSQALTPPTENSCKIALQQLEQMQALDSNENLTVIGHCLAYLPVPPNIGRMMIFSAMFSCLDPILSIAAAQEGKDVSTLVKPDGRGRMKMMQKKDRKTRRDYIAQECKSDHITLIRLIQEWEGHAGYPEAQSAYAKDEYLLNDVLSRKVRLKRQFMSQLKSLGLVNVDDPKDPSYNGNSNNMALLKAILCAGLYPNVALVRSLKLTRKNKQIKGKKLESEIGNMPNFWAQDITPAFFSEEQKLKNNGALPQLHIHPSSYAQKHIDVSTRYLMYSEFVKIESCHYLIKVTPVSPYSLLLFGGRIEYSDDSIALDGHKFTGSQKTAHLIIDVRRQLNRILTGRIDNPEEGQSGEDWKLDEKILLAITDIITSEAERPPKEYAAEEEEEEEEEEPEEGDEDDDDDEDNDQEVDENDEFDGYNENDYIDDGVASEQIPPGVQDGITEDFSSDKFFSDDCSTDVSSRQESAPNWYQSDTSNAYSTPKCSNPSSEPESYPNSYHQSDTSNEYSRPQSSNSSSRLKSAPNSFYQSDFSNEFCRPGSSTPGCTLSSFNHSNEFSRPQSSNSSYHHNAADKSRQGYGQPDNYSRGDNFSGRERQHSTYPENASHSFREEKGWHQDSYQHSAPSNNPGQERGFSNSSFQRRPDNYSRMGPSNSSFLGNKHDTYMRQGRERKGDGFSCLWERKDNSFSDQGPNSSQGQNEQNDGSRTQEYLEYY